jgi:hypothetical protein
LWDEWPDRWGDDTGIDLVAETVGGELWAVQAKCYAQDYSVKKADVDSFLSESSRTLADGRGFAYRLLLATTDRVGSNALKTLDAQAVKIGRLLRSDLAREQVVWPASLAELTPAVPDRKEPREHQREAIDVAAVEYLLPDWFFGHARVTAIGLPAGHPDAARITDAVAQTVLKQASDAIDFWASRNRELPANGGFCSRMSPSVVVV